MNMDMMSLDEDDGAKVKITRAKAKKVGKIQKGLTASYEMRIMPPLQMVFPQCRCNI
jgi:hypothetical protein